MANLANLAKLANMAKVVKLLNVLERVEVSWRSLPLAGVEMGRRSRPLACSPSRLIGI